MHRHLSANDIASMTYTELCGNVDCRHPQANELLREIARREATNPRLRHYAELMR